MASGYRNNFICFEDCALPLCPFDLFPHPKLRKTHAVPITPQPNPLPLRRLRCAAFAGSRPPPALSTPPQKMHKDPGLCEAFILSNDAIMQQDINRMSKGALIRKMRVALDFTEDLGDALEELEEVQLVPLLSNVQATISNSYGTRVRVVVGMWRVAGARSGVWTRLLTLDPTSGAAAVLWAVLQQRGLFFIVFYSARRTSPKGPLQDRPLGRRQPPPLITWSQVHCCGRKCIAVVAGALLWSQVHCCGRRCIAVVAGALLWSQVHCCGRRCIAVVAGALLWSQVHCCGRRCIAVVAGALLWSQVH